MSLSLFLLICSLSIVALIVFLIITLIRVNRFLDKSSVLIDSLNDSVPAIMADLKNTSSNMSGISDSLSQGVNQAAAGLDYLRTFSLGRVIEIIQVLVKGIGFLRNILKRGRA